MIDMNDPLQFEGLTLSNIAVKKEKLESIAVLLAHNAGTS